LPEVGAIDRLRFDYTLMTIDIKALTLKMMFIIIAALELAEPGETHTPNP